QALAAVFTRLQDMELGLHLAHVDLAVGHHRRAHRIAAEFKRLSPELGALGCVQAVKSCLEVRHVELAVVQDGSAELGLQTVHLPDQHWLAVGDLASVQADDPAKPATLQVALALANVDEVARHDGREVDRSLAEEVAPDLDASLDLEGMHS